MKDCRRLPVHLHGGIAFIPKREPAPAKSCNAAWRELCFSMRFMAERSRVQNNTRFETWKKKSDEEETGDEDTKHSEVAPCEKFLLRILLIGKENASQICYKLSPVHSKKKILISGSHGFIGSALVKLLNTEGHEVVRLVRHQPTPGASEVEWHPNKGLINSEQLEGLDGVVHLAGESIAAGRWTSEKKRAILESRVKGTTLLADSLAKLSRPPAVFLSASGTGYYGNRGDELLNEKSTPGDDFLAHVCVEWEKATTPAAEKGIRTVFARFGIILDANGGALAKMLTPFRMGIGGRAGNGKQWMSWMALDDVVGAIRFLLYDNFVNGPVNFVAPHPVTNTEFTKTLGRVLSRPTLFPIPAFALRVAFGELADAALLSGQRVEPAVLQARGFAFGLPRLEFALRKILHREYS